MDPRRHPAASLHEFLRPHRPPLPPFVAATAGVREGPAAPAAAPAAAPLPALLSAARAERRRLSGDAVEA
eukprot:792504-Alexandrium_andersonii.AAC.1